MSDSPHPNAPSGSRFKGHTLRLIAALLAGLLLLLLGGLVGLALTKAVIIAVIGAVVFWLAWVLILKSYLRMARRPS